MILCFLLLLLDQDKTYGHMDTSLSSCYLAHTTESDSSQQERMTSRQNITARQSIRKARADNTTIYKNSSGDDGNDKPHSKSLQLKSRCHRDDEITSTEDKKVGLSLIQMAKDLLGQSSADNTSRSNKSEPITQEAEHDDSLNTHLFYELPDGTPAHVSKFTGEMFYDSIEGNAKQMNSTEYCLTSPLGSNKKLPSIVITPIAEGGDVAINQSNNSLNGSAISTLEMENAKPRPRRRAYSESQVYRRPAFLTPLSSKARSRLSNGSIKRGMPRQFNCSTVRISGVHQIGADDDNKIIYLTLPQ